MSSKMQVVKILLVLCSILQSQNCELLKQGKDDGDGLSYKCGPGEHLTTFKSKYDKTNDDVVYDLECTKSIPMGTCSWRNAKRFDAVKMMEFECPNKGAITGIKAKYSKTSHGEDDMEYEFRCCTVLKPSSYSCMDAKGNEHRIASTEYMSYMFNYFTRRYKDRTFGIKVCKTK